MSRLFRSQKKNSLRKFLQNFILSLDRTHLSDLDLIILSPVRINLVRLNLEMEIFSAMK